MTKCVTQMLKQMPGGWLNYYYYNNNNNNIPVLKS